MHTHKNSSALSIHRECQACPQVIIGDQGLTMHILIQRTNHISPGEAEIWSHLLENIYMCCKTWSSLLCCHWTICNSDMHKFPGALCHGQKDFFIFVHILVILSGNSSNAVPHWVRISQGVQVPADMGSSTHQLGICTQINLDSG